MHELGIVSGVVEVCAKSAREAGASRVLSVRLRIGDMAEVMDESLRFAWEALTEEEPLMRGATLEVEGVHPASICLDCAEEFEHDRFHLRCPACGSADTVLLRGRELEIASIDIETEDD